MRNPDRTNQREAPSRRFVLPLPVVVVESTIPPALTIDAYRKRGRS